MCEAFVIGLSKAVESCVLKHKMLLFLFGGQS